MHTGGDQKSHIGRGFLVFLMAVGIVALAGFPNQVSAFDFDAFRAQLETRKAELNTRLENLRSDVPDIPNVTPPVDTAEDVQESEATPPFCRADVDLARADVFWSGNQLMMRPRVDVNVRADNEPGEGWMLNVAFDGDVTFEPGEGVPTPGQVSFSGSRSFNGPGGDSRFRLSGQTLGSDITLFTIPRSEFGEDDNLEATIRMTLRITGCDTDVIREAFQVGVEEFGNLNVGRWRRVR